MEKQPKYRILVSDRARQMLAAHVRFLAQKSPRAAYKTRTDLMNAIRSLYTMPDRFPFFEAEFIPSNKYHKMFVEKWYLVLFQIRDQTVYVDYVIDCRRDYGWLVR